MTATASLAYWAFLFVAAAADRDGMCSRSVVAIRPGRSSSRSRSPLSCTSLDLVAGAHLELNTVFGYSATIGIRVSGQGNLTFAQLTAAVILLAGLARVATARAAAPCCS